MSTAPGETRDPGSAPNRPSALSATRPLYWSIQRELWEFRSIYVAPLAVAAVFLVGFVIRLFVRGDLLNASLTPAQQLERIQQPYNLAALAVMGATFLVSIFYSLEALHGERRDRSILFWKSLPVSDATAVMAKAVIPLVVLPLLTVVIAMAVHCLMLLASTMRPLGSGSAGQLWSSVPLVSMWVMLLYHMVVIHSLWLAPFYGWMFLVSAWARRAPLLWAFLPLLAIGVLEKLTVNGSRFVNLLMHRMSGVPHGMDYPPGAIASHSQMHIHVGDLLLNPGLWAGLAVTAMFLFLATRLRRQRGPI